MWKTFGVEGEPVPKGRPRLSKGKGYTPARTKAAEKAIWAAAVQAKVKPVKNRPVHVRCNFFMKNPDKCDVDNLLKTVLDALNGQAWEDDRQVYKVEGTKWNATFQNCDPCTVVNLESRPL